MAFGQITESRRAAKFAANAPAAVCLLPAIPRWANQAPVLAAASVQAVRQLLHSCGPLGKLIERAGVAAKIGFKVHMHRAKTIPPQLSPARCGRLLAQTNTSLGHTLTPMHRCTWH